MKSSTKAEPRLLDQWRPPPRRGTSRDAQSSAEAGNAVGCLATTFTFDPVFFEEECLARFASIGSEPDSESVSFLVEREERLAMLECAAVLVDRNHASGRRNLRWDLLPVRPRGQGILHAKISLLCWEHHIRLMIGSANLTEDGYRRNREVFGVLDYHDRYSSPDECLLEVVGYLRDLLELTAAGEPARERARRLLGRVEQQLADFTPGKRDEVRVWPILVRPGGTPVTRQIADTAPAFLPASKLEVLSPFFDPPENTDSPAARAACEDLLRKRGERDFVLHVLASQSASGGLQAHAPAHIKNAVESTRATFKAALLDHDARGERTIDEDAERALHAKALWIEKPPGHVMCLIGSSNFTARGLGLRKEQSNFEANLLYGLQPREGSRDRSQLRAAFAEGQRWQGELDWLAPDEELDGESNASAVALPDFFGSAVMRGNGDGPCVTLALSFNQETASPGVGWRVRLPERSRLLLDNATWVDLSKPPSFEATLDSAEGLPSGLEVQWDDQTEPAWWPVTVESAATLPPIEGLRDLPLEVLLSQIGSARPIHLNAALLRFLQQRISGGEADTALAAHLDPHRRVDTSGFLLQRTRRFGQAMRSLRQRLSEPFTSEAALSWNLRGPCGVTQLAAAIQRDSLTAADDGTQVFDEAAFLLAELLLVLREVRPTGDWALRQLPAKRVSAALKELVKHLAQGLPQEGMDAGASDYLRAVHARLRT